MIRSLFSEALPAYLDRHKDLLFHQPPEAIFNGFFIGRVAEALLQSIASGVTDRPKIIEDAFDRLDDFVGYRPVPSARTSARRAIPGEYVRPVPLYIEGAGVSDGPYREIIERALASLRQTSPGLLRAASFDPDRLQSLLTIHGLMTLIIRCIAVRIISLASGTLSVSLAMVTSHDTSFAKSLWHRWHRESVKMQPWIFLSIN